MGYDDYHIVKPLRTGSCSETSLVTKGNDPKQYVLKVIPCHGQYAKYSQEVDVLCDIQGLPGVAQYVEHFEDDDNIIIVYEYCDGMELFDYLLEYGPLSESDAKEIFRQLCVTMDTVHKRGIVHRDLKLENIIIDKNKRITIIDWGFAFYPQKTTERISCGSPNYASPELITLSKDKEVSYDGPELDVWSLGCVLYIMLTKKMPFNEIVVIDLFTKIRTCDLFYPGTLPEEAVDVLKQIFVRENRCSLEDILISQWLNPAEPWYYRSTRFIEKLIPGRAG